MPGKLDIYNMALGFIGVRTLSSENERTPEAAQCSLYWDRARRGALREFPWPFSQKKIRLMSVALPTEQAAYWSHAYSMPRDVLKINRINDYAAFEIGQDEEILKIYCDEAEAIAQCTMDATDITIWDELFVIAVAYRLAMFIAVPLLKNNPAKIQELSQIYASLLPTAQGQAASEYRKARNTEDDWLAARGSW